MFQLDLQHLFILYLLLGANFLVATFGCQVQQFFNTNIYAKHIIGLLTVFYFIILATSPLSAAGADEFVFFQKLGAASLIYAVFIASGRMTKAFFLAFIVTILTNFLLKMYGDSLDPVRFADRQQIINTSGQGLHVLALAILVVGVGQYFLKQRQQHAAKFNLFTFILGKPHCAKL